MDQNRVKNTKKKKRKRNPIERANLFSLISFLFTWDLFRASLRKELGEEDVYDIVKKCRSKTLGDRLEKEWSREIAENNERPSLFRALARMFGMEYIVIGLNQLLFRVIITTLQPILLGKFVSFFNRNQTDLDLTDAFLYASGIIATCLLRCVCNHNCMFYVQQLSLKARIATCSLLYRDLLRRTDVNSNIVTLMSKDVYSYEMALMFGNDLCIGAIQTVIMGYIMYDAIGSSAFAGLCFMIVLVPVQLVLGRIIANQRRKGAVKTDERLKLFQEVLATMKIIKMYASEESFIKRINAERKGEMQKLRIVYYVKSLLLSLAALSIRISFYLSALTYFYSDENVTAEQVFIVLSSYLTLRSVLTMGIPNGISHIAEAKVSLSRLTEALRAPAANDCKKIGKSYAPTRPSIKLTNVHVDMGMNANIFNELNLNLCSGLIALTGPIGSGKSMLLKTILRFVEIKSGNIEVNGTVSYASQEPWLFPGTVKQNIVFGERYDAETYAKVLQVCALNDDVERLPYGNETTIVDNGTNLSRGQQARINLARAIYREADIYLLDDPFSSLDSRVGRSIMSQLRNYLKAKLCLLITHQHYCLINSDKVLLLRDGVLVEDTPDGLNDEPEMSVVNDSRINYECSDTNKTKNDDESKEDTKLLNGTPTFNGESKNVGKVQAEMYRIYLESAGSTFYKLLLIAVFILATISGSFFDYYVKIWINMEENEQNFSMHNETTYHNVTDSQDRSMVQIYFAIILIGTIVFSLLQSIFFFNFTTRASTVLHKSSFDKIIKASMSFFDANSTGTILNRFSKDVGVIDEYLPNAYYEVLRIFFILLGMVFVIIYTHYLFVFYSILAGLAIFIMTNYYLPASRSLKRLEGTTKSPLIGHLNATMEGLSTIRAHQKQKFSTKLFDLYQDLNSSTSYMYSMASRAFGFYLDVICVVYLATIAFSFLISYPNVIDSNVGLAITQAFGLTSVLQWAIRKLTEVENYMTSVERVVEYAFNAKQEESDGEKIASWPNNGSIEFRNVCMNYSDSAVLRNVSFTIEPNERVGIVGRTGAGKTSIISSMFRLYEIEGDILIDGCNIKDINLNYLRRRLSIIPQEPVLFAGSLRSNLDLNDEYSDESLWKALDIVHMKNNVKDLNDKVDAIGFSTGQKHLICLARAVLKESKILCLDEAAANVDIDTDRLIQSTIKNHFANCTIIIVAHRISNVIDADRVLVLDDGSLLECDSPQKLLNNPDSYFHQLAKLNNII